MGANGFRFGRGRTSRQAGQPGREQHAASQAQQQGRPRQQPPAGGQYQNGQYPNGQSQNGQSQNGQYQRGQYPYDPYQGGGGYDGYDDQPGHTRAFNVADAGGDRQGPTPPASAPSPADGGYGQGPYAAASPHPYGEPPENPPAPPRGFEEGNVTVYRAGSTHPPVSGRRLGWRELLPEIYRHPTRTFAEMRGYPVWGPALVVSAVYGLLAVLGFGTTRDQIFHSTLTIALSSLLFSAAGIVLAGLMFGAVTSALARQFGGDGAWAPTIGLSMIIAWTTDAPRLVFALFLDPGGGFVQFLGWITWILCCWLLTVMVRQVHDLPWGKAAGAAAIQLVALLILIKLPTLS